MARKKQDSGTKAVQQEIKDLRAQSRDLLRRANKTRKEFQKEVSALKKAGVVAKYKDIRKQRPTKYMLSKVRKFADIISGENIAVRAPKEIREKYKAIGKEIRGPFIITRRDDLRQKAIIEKERGLIKKTIRHPMMLEHRIILPYRLIDLGELAEGIKNGSIDIDKLKKRNEQFGFQVFGHNSTIGYPDAETFAEDLLMRYKHILHNEKAFSEFILLAFSHAKGMPQSAPYVRPKYSNRVTQYSPTGRSEMNEHKREKWRQKKARQRSRETPEQHQKRIEKQRIRQAQYRQRKFEEKQ